MSDKSVFGQCGPKNILYLYEYFSQQTICRKLWSIYIYNTNFKYNKYLRFVFKIGVLNIQNTKHVSNNIYSFLVHREVENSAIVQDGAPSALRVGLQLVKIFVLNNNPQITKARIIFISKFIITYFFELCMLVGISEAIRLLLTYYINLIKLIKLILLICLPNNNIIISGIKYSGISNEVSFCTEKNKDFNMLSTNSFNE
jgi:hypothetical protein